jgi:hypothetical protein
VTDTSALDNHSNGNRNEDSGSRNQHSIKRNERGNGRGRPTKRTSATQEAILASIEKGLPFSLACSRAGVSHEFFIQWRQDDPGFESLVAQAYSVSVEHNLEVVRTAAANGDWKAAAWMLERSHPKMFSRPEVQVQLNQQFNVQGQGGWLSDAQSLQEARAKLDEVIAIKAARRREEAEASIEEVHDDHRPAIIAPQPDDSKPAEPEPSPQSPTPAEPVERWRDKHPVEPSLRQKLLAQARRTGRSDGDGKGVF